MVDEQRTRTLGWLVNKPLTARRAGQAIAVFTVLATVASGLLMWVVDHKDFPSAGAGLWWAVQTVTTVGYGDHTPTTAVGQIIAAFVMVSGLGFLSVVTAAVTAVFIESARERLRPGEQERGEDRMERLEERLERIEQLLRERSAGP